MEYTVKIYDDSRAYIQINNRNPFINRKKSYINNQSRNYQGYMPINDIKKSNRRWIKKLIALDIDSSKCKFVTLTLSHAMEWDELISKFQIFMNNIKRKYDNQIEYIRAVEIQKKSLNYHIHIVLVFKDKVAQFKRKDIQKLWQYGNVDIENNVYNVFGIIEYLTLNKSTIRQKEDSKLSYFPKGARLIASTIKAKADYRQIIISVDEIKNMIDHCQSINSYIRYDKHKYYDNGVPKTVLDGILVMPGNDYIINNFGTKADDELIEKLLKDKQQVV